MRSTECHSSFTTRASFTADHEQLTTLTGRRQLDLLDGEFGQRPRLAVLLPGRLRPDAVQVGVVAVAADQRLDAVDERLQPLYLLLLLPYRVQVVDAVELELRLQVENFALQRLALDTNIGNVRKSTCFGTSL